MAGERRGFVWLRCTVCNHRNYRTERRLTVEPISQGKSKKRFASMDGNNRLKLQKYCSVCRVHTEHKEDRKAK